MIAVFGLGDVQRESLTACQVILLVCFLCNRVKLFLIFRVNLSGQGYAILTVKSVKVAVTKQLVTVGGLVLTMFGKNMITNRLERDYSR